MNPNPRKLDNPVTVLIVDDEPGIRQVIASGFEKRGCRVLSAANGNDAFEIIQKENKIDAVITDIRMPGGNGIELLENIKDLNVRIPVVVFMSGYSDLSTEDVYHLGAEAIFAKPFKREHLVTAVMKFLTIEEEKWKTPLEGTKQEIQREYKTLDPHSPEKKSGNEFHLGRGGMFLALKGEALEINDPVRFEIKLSDAELPLLSGSGMVRWVRDENSGESTPGFGIEFSYFTDPIRAQVIAVLGAIKTRAFIPKK